MSGGRVLEPPILYLGAWQSFIPTIIVAVMVLFAQVGCLQFATGCLTASMLASPDLY